MAGHVSQAYQNVFVPTSLQDGSAAPALTVLPGSLDDGGTSPLSPFALASQSSLAKAYEVAFVPSSLQEEEEEGRGTPRASSRASSHASSPRSPSNKTDKTDSPIVQQNLLSDITCNFFEPASATELVPAADEASLPQPESADLAQAAVAHGGLLQRPTSPAQVLDADEVPPQLERPAHAVDADDAPPPQPTSPAHAVDADGESLQEPQRPHAEAA